MYERELRRDWALLGLESFIIGTLIWHSRINDTNMHRAMQMFSEPYLIFLPFILGVISFTIATIWQRNVNIIKITLVTSVMYWSAFATLSTMNDLHEMRTPVLGGFGLIVVLRILNMAYLDNHGADI